ncbi:hypothetical protein K2173_021973 [Erythroxylum novogranatense]|uniref:Ribosomal protein L18 n=1 Tax=Erythroxylum novogranatense TaxID=1862640 RepID=A0AAV8T3T1_9ROSI|nr:hypothetical protein K2173_021973 [Erythroxylum novogranatense]
MGLRAIEDEYWRIKRTLSIRMELTMWTSLVERDWNKIIDGENMIPSILSQSLSSPPKALSSHVSPFVEVVTPYSPPSAPHCHVVIEASLSLLSSVLGITMFQKLETLDFRGVPSLRFKNSDIFGALPKPCTINPIRTLNLRMTTIVAKSKNITRKESAKTLNRRRLKKFNGTPTKPRLSVFCSTKQLYAMVVDDQNKKCLFYGSTLQKSIHGDQPCSIAEAAELVGEELVKACIELNIDEVFYDRNGFARGERIKAFEIPISHHGFLPDRSFRRKST